MYYYCEYWDRVTDQKEPLMPFLSRIAPISAKTEARLLREMYAHFTVRSEEVAVYVLTLTEDHCNKRHYRISHKGYVRYDGYNIFTGEPLFQREQKPWQ